jgi:hypothetical protein
MTAHREAGLFLPIVLLAVLLVIVLGCGVASQEPDLFAAPWAPSPPRPPRPHDVQYILAHPVASDGARVARLTVGAEIVDLWTSARSG